MKSRLDLIHPDMRRKVEQKQEEQELHHDRKVKERNFGPGESVAVENHSKLTNSKWIPAMVVSKTGLVSYVVETQDGQKLRRHVDKNATQVPKPVPERINDEQRKYPKRDHKVPRFLDNEQT